MTTKTKAPVDDATEAQQHTEKRTSQPCHFNADCQCGWPDLPAPCLVCRGIITALGAAMRSAIKRLIVALAMRDVIPARLAECLIRRGGLRDA